MNNKASMNNDIMAFAQHGKAILKTKCVKDQFHIAILMIQIKYFALHNVSTIKCNACVCKSTRFKTLLPIYVRKNKIPTFHYEWKFKVHQFWFCAYDKFKCVIGTKQ